MQWIFFEIRIQVIQKIINQLTALECCEDDVSIYVLFVLFIVFILSLVY